MQLQQAAMRPTPAVVMMGCTGVRVVFTAISPADAFLDAFYSEGIPPLIRRWQRPVSGAPPTICGCPCLLARWGQTPAITEEAHIHERFHIPPTPPPQLDTASPLIVPPDNQRDQTVAHSNTTCCSHRMFQLWFFQS